MPMSTDGKRDMFWVSDWDPEAQAAECMEQFGVSPREGWGATEYGGYDSWSQGKWDGVIVFGCVRRTHPYMLFARVTDPPASCWKVGFVSRVKWNGRFSLEKACKEGIVVL